MNLNKFMEEYVPNIRVLHFLEKGMSGKVIEFRLESKQDFLKFAKNLNTVWYRNSEGCKVDWGDTEAKNIPIMELSQINIEEERKKRIDKLRKIIENRGIHKIECIITQDKQTGKIIVLDGNHRLFALCSLLEEKKGSTLPCEIEIINYISLRNHIMFPYDFFNLYKKFKEHPLNFLKEKIKVNI